MGKFLIKVDETYRADTEAEAIQLINEAREDNRFSLAKHSSVQKQTKAKGEIVDEWWRVTLTKVFDEEKEPIGSTTIEYNTSDSAF